jgi:hypothetical protein
MPRTRAAVLRWTRGTDASTITRAVDRAIVCSQRPPKNACTGRVPKFSKIIRHLLHSHFEFSVYSFPRRALTLCPQLCMGIQPGARFPARSADALPATPYGHFTQAIYRNRPIISFELTYDKVRETT